MKRFFIAIIAAIMCTISAKAQVNLGQIYDKGGVKGLVAYVDESGQHGLLLSLQESDKNWLADMSLEMETNAFYEDDGMKRT